MSREAFGKPLAKLGGNTRNIAKAMDELPMQQARIWVSAVKAMVPHRVCDIIDHAIQMHGGLGVSQRPDGVGSPGLRSTAEKHR